MKTHYSFLDRNPSSLPRAILLGLHQPPRSSLPPILWAESGTTLWQAKRGAHGGTILSSGFLCDLWKFRAVPLRRVTPETTLQLRVPSLKMDFVLAWGTCLRPAVGSSLADLRRSGSGAPFTREKGTVQKCSWGPSHVSAIPYRSLSLACLSLRLPGTFCIPKCGDFPGSRNSPLTILHWRALKRK